MNGAQRRAYADLARRTRARFPGRCARCGTDIRPGDAIVYDGVDRRTLCMRDACGPQRERDMAAAAHDQAFCDGAWV